MTRGDNPRHGARPGWIPGARAVAAVLGLAIATGAQATAGDLPEGPLQVPSGQLVTLQEAFWEQQDDGALWLRLRFIAPRIGSGPGEYGFDVVEWDMAHLCETLGIPWAAEGGAEVIVVSFAAEAVEFGTSAPEVAQFFEAYRPVAGECMWEDY
ncbi:MAG: DUF6497 family protein [Alkalilacustris sp.]